MNTCTLNIASYLIRLHSDDFDLVPGKRFESFAYRSLDPANNTDTPDAGSLVNIKVYSEKIKLPSGSVCLFHAPFVEEINGTRLQKDPEFWIIWKYDKDLFIKTTFPLSHGNKKGLLKFSLDTIDWDLYIDHGGEKITDPLEYPLDGLILYYLSVSKGDIMVHASGVNYQGKGYVFSGISGKGKTTISRLWKNAGASIIHDDRLIIKKSAKGFKMYNTPVYDDEKPFESDIDSIFIIQHGRENTHTKLEGAQAATALMANCIQHNWGRETIAGLLRSVTELSSEVPVYSLSFTPDASVVNHLIKG